ncbi:MAG: transcription termination/antitermination NusG family protein, partial [Planctomycetaceae bacterium]
MTVHFDDETPASAAGGPGAPFDGAEQAALPPATAAAPPADEEDDGPVEVHDPFAGDENARPVEVAGAEPSVPVGEHHWYILKVQSNREDSIREALQRRISLQGMDRWFGEVVVPKEQVTEFKGGKKRVVWRKLYPGYILVNMILNDETWYLVRETGGI